ncbi:unnamed protein product [Owenia fusiformis]|uniref:Uncharacterized protein n=1 Tax=Owenia fusiformis TaxID=6347 RepID=A0A8J1TXV3_OWEFU|nr:unnamed protein product [Owenia fusiformis]
MKLLIVMSVLILSDVSIIMGHRGIGRGLMRLRGIGYRGNVEDELDEFSTAFNEALLEPDCSVRLNCSNLGVFFTGDVIFAPQDVPRANGIAEAVTIIEFFKNQDPDVYSEIDFTDITECRWCKTITAFGIQTLFSKDAAGQPLELIQYNLLVTFRRTRKRRETKLEIKYWVTNDIPESPAA